MAAIETTNLTKRYGDFTAVDNLSLTIREGEVYGLLGPNGAGKSTTIDMLMDYTRPSEGTATVFGYDAQSEATAVHERTGILPDRFGVYETLTGREHVRYILDANGDSGNPATTLERVGLGEAIDDPTRQYSKGMQQRLGLAMALAGDPKLLILDEPFAGLDPRGVRLVREIVEEERDSGTTVLFSSHVLDQVERLCDRIGLVSHGSLVQTGTPQKLRAVAGIEQQLVVTISEGKAEALTAIDTVEGVQAVHDEGDRLLIDCPPKRRYKVLSTIDAAGGTIQAVTVDESTIEAAFLELVDQ